MPKTPSQAGLNISAAAFDLARLLHFQEQGEVRFLRTIRSTLFFQARYFPRARRTENGTPLRKIDHGTPRPKDEGVHRPFRIPREFRRSWQPTRRAWFSLPDGGADSTIRIQLSNSWRQPPAARIPPILWDEARRRHRSPRY